MIAKVYTNSFGFIYVDLYSSKYNNYTLDQIKRMPFAGWHEMDKKSYIQNCKEVIDIQMSGVNLGMIECLKNANFNITKRYV